MTIDWQAVRQRLAESEGAMERSLSPDATRMRAVLRQRAARLAARRQCGEAEATLEVLSFRLGEEWCGLELTAVAEVQPFQRCTSVPGMPPELLGVVNLRGQIRPVLDLRRVIGAKAGAADQGGHVLFLRHPNGEIGARVDKIEAVRRLRPDLLAQPGEETGGLSSRFARGIAPEGVAVLNAAAVTSALMDVLTPAA